MNSRQYQVFVVKFGTVMAPSLRLRSRSTSASMSIADSRPVPSHTGHIPSGRLNENAPELPACGSPSRLNSMRNIA